ncbi:MAG TPA: alpha/beta hydrolase [Chloroflexia bacterium]|nr:alpha/beta hydrolase [Chloroflexia bacterium]
MEEHRVDVDESEVYYTARGPEDARFAYVGINGLLGGGDSFWPVIEGVPASWQVALPDLPGCGASEPMKPPRRHDLDGYVRWLDRFVEAAGLGGKQLVLASVATGAPISIRYAVQRRERVAGQVLHMPFLGKPVIPAKWLRPVIGFGLLAAPTRALMDRLRSSDRLMHRVIIHEPPHAIPELAERDIAHKQQGDLKAAGELLHSLMLTDSRAELALLHSPVLILDSEHDELSPTPMMQSVVRGRPERTLYTYSGGMHSWNEEFISEMNREIAQFTRRIEVESSKAMERPAQ